MSENLRKVGRGLSVTLCAALVAAITCMAVAVLIQALAVLIIAVLAAALLLPHPLKWYAKEGADAVRLFVHELFGSMMKPAESAAASEPAAPADKSAEQNAVPAPRERGE